MRAESIIDKGSRTYKPQNQYEALTCVFEAFAERYGMSYHDVCIMPLPAFFRYLDLLEIRIEQEKEQTEKSSQKSSGTFK